MRVVLDTNVVISGMLWSGQPGKILRLAQSGRVDTVTTEVMVDELRDVLQRPKLARYLTRQNKKPEELVAEYLSYTSIVEPASVPEDAIRDVKDVKVLEAAVGGEVECCEPSFIILTIVYIHVILSIIQVALKSG